MGWKELADSLFPLQVGHSNKVELLDVVSIDMVTSKVRSLVGNVQILQLSCIGKGSV